MTEVYVCYGDDGSEVGKGVYGVFTKKEYAEDCKKINGDSNIQIFERELDIGQDNGPICKIYKE